MTPKQVDFKQLHDYSVGVKFKDLGLLPGLHDFNPARLPDSETVEAVLLAVMSCSYSNVISRCAVER